MRSSAKLGNAKPWSAELNSALLDRGAKHRAPIYKGLRKSPSTLGSRFDGRLRSRLARDQEHPS